MSTERLRSRSPPVAVAGSKPIFRDGRSDKPVYRDGRSDKPVYRGGRSDRMMKRAPPVRGPVRGPGQQTRVYGRVPLSYRSRDSQKPDNSIDGAPWNSRSMTGRREFILDDNDMYSDEEYYSDDPDDCQNDYMQNSGDGYQGYDGYKDIKDNFAGHPKRGGFQSRREFESQRGGFESRRRGFESRRGTGMRSEEYGHSRPRREADYGEYPRQGGFQSRGKFDTHYPDDNGIQENRENRFEARPGDWTCTQCMFSNFASRTSCYKCQKDKGEGAPETLDLKNWECTECFASNHQRRFECFKCQKSKPKNAKECEKLSDWDCSNCRSNNSARRTNCGRCDAARPGREKELEANPDWKCGGCGIMNWSWREGCYKCQANKSDGKIPEGAPQDWDCKDCGKSNWARRNQCFGCKAEKSG